MGGYFFLFCLGRGCECIIIAQGKYLISILPQIVFTYSACFIIIHAFLRMHVAGYEGEKHVFVYA